MKIANKWRELLAEFKIEYYETDDRIICPCPVHDGKYQSSFNITINPTHPYYGKWFCNSEQCHKKFGSDLIGLVWGLLSKREEASFNDAIRFCEKFCKGIEGNFEYAQNDVITNFLLRPQKEDKKFLTREQVRQRLKIPAKYYLNRQFSAKVLDEFDVGYCDNPKSNFYSRVVFPVYSTDGLWMIGATGRITIDGPNKWINSKGFSKSSHLYGYHKAIKRAKETGALILVEGQGDVLRLHETGIINTVGLFGCALSDSQEFLLQKSGIMDIILVLDNDESGQHGRLEIQKRLQNLFNIHVLTPSQKDVGDMNSKDILTMFNSLRKFI